MAMKAEGVGTDAGGPGICGACGVVHPKISHTHPALSTSLFIVVLVHLDFNFDSRRIRIRKRYIIGAKTLASNDTAMPPVSDEGQQSSGGADKPSLSLLKERRFKLSRCVVLRFSFVIQPESGSELEFADSMMALCRRVMIKSVR